jgi:hypothetical protein
MRGNLIGSLKMDILFRGSHDSEAAAESLLSVLRLFKDRYQISQFREMHLSVTLVNDKGEDVELIDSETSQVYRRFEVYRNNSELQGKRGQPILQLIVDNTR